MPKSHQARRWTGWVPSVGSAQQPSSSSASGGPTTAEQKKKVESQSGDRRSLISEQHHLQRHCSYNLRVSRRDDDLSAGWR